MKPQWYHEISAIFGLFSNLFDSSESLRTASREILINRTFSLMSSAASATEKPQLSLLSATLVNSVPLSPEVRLLTLRVEDGSLAFLPGQCVRVEQELDGKVVHLVYSIASPPRADNCFELCVKPGRKGSPADRLCATRVGAELRISRPQGGFVVQQRGPASLFLAAGTGIAPIRSMIHSLVGTGRHRDDEMASKSEALTIEEVHARFDQSRKNRRRVSPIPAELSSRSGKNSATARHRPDSRRLHLTICESLA